MHTLTAVAGEADYICTLDKDFYTPEVTAFCGSVGIMFSTISPCWKRLTF
jgi:hypothetical protein